MNFVFQSAESFEPVEDSFSIGFTEDPCKISFNAGCNTIGGEYQLVDGVFEMSEPYSTYLECETILMEQESWLVTFFTSSPTVVHDGDTITFSGAATLMFAEE